MDQLLDEYKLLLELVTKQSTFSINEATKTYTSSFWDHGSELKR